MTQPPDDAHDVADEGQNLEKNADDQELAQGRPSSRDAVLASAVNTLLSVADQLPAHDEVQPLVTIAEAASQRGHFLPDEDDQIRNVLSRYLTTRAALMESLNELKPHVLSDVQQTNLNNEKEPDLALFLTSFCIACMLMRSGRFLIDVARDDKVLLRKLDEPEPRLGIPPKQFTTIYQSLRSIGSFRTFSTGIDFWRQHREKFESLADDPQLGPVYQLQLAEEPFIDHSLSTFTEDRVKYRVHSIRRKRQASVKRISFAIFEASGRVIAELRNQWRRKRVTPGVQRKIHRLLQPGDVIITRHDDAASNLFLPGFWPHGALYIGSLEEREAMGVEMSKSQRERSRDSVVLEARKDGVLFRQLPDTLSVDAFTVIRPQMSQDHIRNALSRAITHEGKKYDFEFDFRRSDRLVCTEVIYRAYHGEADLRFELSRRAGRVCLSAEDLLDLAVDEAGFEVVAVYGESGNKFSTGALARERLLASYRTPTN